MPVTAAQAAQAAVHDDAAAMVVDVAGPVLFVVEGPTVLAEASWRPQRRVRWSAGSGR